MRYREKLSKHDLLTAKHFCYRYPELCEKREDLYYTIKSPQYDNQPTGSKTKKSLVEEATIRAAHVSAGIDIIEKSVKLATKNDAVLYPYILEGVTDEFATFGTLSQKGLPCCRNTYYTIVRRVYHNIINLLF